MSYIGQTLPADTFQGFTTDSFTGDGSATTFTLSKTPFNESALLVVINNVVQKPTTNFTVSGTTLTIVGTAVASSDVIYATHIGGALPIGQAASLDLNGASDQLILDADADTTISADTDDQIDFKLGGVDEMTMSSSGIVINEGSNNRDFRIETNGNANMLVVDGGDDDVRIGTATSFGPHDAGLKVKGDITIGDFTADSASATLGFIKSRNTTVGSQTIVANDDEIGRIAFRADDGDDANYNNNVAAIFCQIDAAPGTNDTGGRLQFSTTADGARTVTERMRIHASGNVEIGATDDNAKFKVTSSTTGENVIRGFVSGNYTSTVVVSSCDRNTTNGTYSFYTAVLTGVEQRFTVADSGNVTNSNNSYGQISDERLKSNIVDANSQWDDIKALKVRNFKKAGNSDMIQIGVVAQELEAANMNGLVEEKNPDEYDIKHNSVFGTLYTSDDAETKDGQDAVLYTADDYEVIEGSKNVGDVKSKATHSKKVGEIKEVKEKVKSVKYSVLYMKAIKALQEAMAKIETLETKVKALEDA